jgi:hypothetical protein
MGEKPMHFFILGAAKCGTTSLHFYLNQHPSILMSRPKETLFFEKEFDKGVAHFRSVYFPDWRKEQLLGEARHRNLLLPYVPPLVAQSFPNAKLIVILRNPVDRAYSHYLHRKNRGFESLPFQNALEKDLQRIQCGGSFNIPEGREKYLNQLAPDGASMEYRTYLDCGYYAEQIQRYLKYFDRNQLLVLFLEDLKKDPISFYSDTLAFLDPKLPLVDVLFSPKNRRTNRINIVLSKFLSKHHRFRASIPPFLKEFFQSITMRLTASGQDIPDDTRAWLVSHYMEHNQKLENLTGRDLSHWNL